MAIRKSFVIAGAATALSLAAVGVASAASGSTGDSTLVNNIANHFHLDKTAVQQVIDQTKQQNQASREQKYEARLTAAVTAGKLTAAQQTLILTKHNELIADRTALKGDTPTARRAAIKQERSDLKTWETQNNIPAGYLGFGRLR